MPLKVVLHRPTCDLSCNVIVPFMFPPFYLLHGNNFSHYIYFHACLFFFFQSILYWSTSLICMINWQWTCYTIDLQQICHLALHVLELQSEILHKNIVLDTMLHSVNFLCNSITWNIGVSSWPMLHHQLIMVRGYLWNRQCSMAFWSKRELSVYSVIIKITALQEISIFITELLIKWVNT